MHHAGQGKRQKRSGKSRSSGVVPSETEPAGPAIPAPVGNEGLDAKVLVLNRLYLAVRVVTARRAFALLFRDIAEIIHVEDGQYLNYDFETWADLARLRESWDWSCQDWIRTVDLQIPVPRVIRLLGYDRLPRQEVKLNRRNLFARDRNRCQYCGHHFPTSELSIDHVVPRTLGGRDTWDNLVCACVRCNARKGGRTPEQARMSLIHTPAQPRRNPLISARIAQEKYQSWRAFLDNAYWTVELK